jgi:hypothetical protein
MSSGLGHKASKMRLVRILFLTVCFAWPFSLLWAQSPQLLEDAQVEQRVTELLGQLTPQEKFDQIVDFSDSSTGPGSPHVDYREQIAKCRAGSLENVRGAAEKNALQSLAIEKSRLYIPLLCARISRRPPRRSAVHAVLHEAFRRLQTACPRGL